MLQGAARAAEAAAAGCPWPDGARPGVADRLLEAAELGAGSTSPLIAVDNLQWADQGSLTVLASVMRRTVPLGWRFVFGARTAPWPDALSQLLVAAAEVGGSEVAVDMQLEAVLILVVINRIDHVTLSVVSLRPSCKIVPVRSCKFQVGSHVLQRHTPPMRPDRSPDHRVQLRSGR